MVAGNHRMARFSVRVSVAHPTEPDRRADVDLLVDTSATLSWVPRPVIEHIDPPRMALRSFLLAGRRTIERETALMRVQLDGTEAGVTVVVAEPGDGHLLGATTLETLGFGVDPVGQRLVPRALLAMKVEPCVADRDRISILRA